jgi:hypothetical protein
MTDATEYTIGAQVACSDGACGQLSRIVVDPVGRALTHLVVDPKHRVGGRLVPVSLVESAATEIRLRCTISEFDALEAAEETRFLPESGEVGGQFGYGASEAFAWPYYGLGRGVGGLGVGEMAGAPVPVIIDRVPVEEVEVRRDEHVHASDGDIGRVQGLVVDPDDQHVTHVLLQEGHLWGKKDVAIPIGAVTEVSADGVRLDLSKDQVRDLPPVELTRHG